MNKILPLIVSLLFFQAAYALTPGNSGWVYGFKSNWITKIQQTNTSPNPQNHFGYLFVNVGSTFVDSKKHQLKIHYNPKIIAKYHQQLPQVKILSNLSFWIKGTSFFHWNKKEYQAAADQIAHLINNDPNSSGVFLDLEIYKPRLIPFYTELQNKLAKQGKILAFIVRPGEETVNWFKQTGSNSIAVLYGYDLHKPSDSSLPVSPTTYAKRLQKAVNHFVDTANQAKQHFMIGIPAVATTYEWHTKTVMSGSVLKNPYSQISYFKQAKAICSNIHSKYYLGVSLWAFVEKTQDQIYRPLKVSPKEWKILQG